jgi:hypothetical protein
MAHVVLGDFDTASLSRTAFLPALSGESIEVKSVSGSIFIGGAHVLRPDLRVINGVIHIVDSAVQPFRPAESAAPTFAPTTSCDWSCQALQVDRQAHSSCRFVRVAMQSSPPFRATGLARSGFS